MKTYDLIRALRHFNTIDNKMQVSTILTLLEIAYADELHRDISVSDVRERVGLKSGTASRNVGYWADGNRDVSGAYRMIRSDVSRADQRQRSLRLTEKGRAFVNNIRTVGEIEHGGNQEAREQVSGGHKIN